MARLIYGEYPPHSTLNYVWASTNTGAAIITSPYTDRAKIIPLESGPAKIGTWTEEHVDALGDYIRAFGTPPPGSASLAIMSDSDNTGESARAYIEYIEIY